ncbi:MAG: hypothetical protein B6D55_01535 [Candidatus Omnitrophica bacterium 4484_70.2]|nr:MAG: hypothetical protein B6D55_01535 [Candidatus Omnitrophica bacterium 4484_70.2]
MKTKANRREKVKREVKRSNSRLNQKNNSSSQRQGFRKEERKETTSKFVERKVSSSRKENVFSSKKYGFPKGSNVKGSNVRKKVFVDNEELPASYNVTNLTLMVRDPYGIHAYWEITPSSIEEVRKKIGEEVERCAYVLRMYDVTYKIFDGSNANHQFDIEVGPHTNNWYINLWCDNTSYCGEIGLRTPKGEFFPLARSNYITTPSAGFSPRKDIIWMEVKDNVKQPPFVFVERREGKGSSLSKKGEFSSQEEKKRVYKMFLTEDDIRAYYSRLFPLLRKVSSLQRERKDEEEFSKYGGSRLISEENLVLREETLLFPGLIPQQGLTGEEFIKKILLGSSQELVLKQGASEFAKDVTSRGAAKELGEEKKREFFFEIGTEFIVYGRTEPDAKVWFNDKEIPLRSDGTFSLRFALDDGKIPLNFVAQSSDKVESRSISTAVERSQTIYNP